MNQWAVKWLTRHWTARVPLALPANEATKKRAVPFQKQVVSSLTRWPRASHRCTATKPVGTMPGGTCQGGWTHVRVRMVREDGQGTGNELARGPYQDKTMVRGQATNLQGWSGRGQAMVRADGQGTGNELARGPYQGKGHAWGQGPCLATVNEFATNDYAAHA